MELEGRWEVGRACVRGTKTGASGKGRGLFAGWWWRRWISVVRKGVRRGGWSTEVIRDRVNVRMGAESGTSFLRPKYLFQD